MAKSDCLPFLSAIHLFICLFIYSFIKTPQICLRCRSSSNVLVGVVFGVGDLCGAYPRFRNVCAEHSWLKVLLDFYHLQFKFHIVVWCHIKLILSKTHARAAVTFMQHKGVRHQISWLLTFSPRSVSVCALRQASFLGQIHNDSPHVTLISQARWRINHFF